MSDLIKILKEKDIDLKKLSKHSGVPLGFLKKLQNDDFKSLPPYPYVRGYFFRLANTLRMDKEKIEEDFKRFKKINLKTSGKNDKLPNNRFSLNKLYKKRYLIFLSIVVIILVFLYLFKSFTGPSIYFDNPSLNSKKLIFVSNSLLDLSGKIPQNCLLYLNNRKVLVGAKGKFDEKINLEQGLNTLNIKIKSLFGRQKNIIKQVFLK